MTSRGPFLAIAGLLALGTTQAFYLPGRAPKTFSPDEKVDLQVVQLTSTRTQIPFDYYKAPHCNSGKHDTEAENLGEVLLGDRIASSDYNLYMEKDVKCAILCERELSEDDVKKFRYYVDNKYRVHMQVDHLPVASVEVTEDSSSSDTPQRILKLGYLVGFSLNEERFLNNHLSFTVKYHESDQYEGSRIVGFDVVPRSIHHRPRSAEGNVGGGDGGAEVGMDETAGRRNQRRWLANGATDNGEDVLSTCPDWDNLSSEHFSLERAQKVVFTYDVRWERDPETDWAHRWDKWFKGNPPIHYFSIVNSLMITLFLTGVVAMILLRTLRKEISAYNEMQSLEDAQEESGWKLVHGDVFRPPSFSPMLLSVLCGTGMQVFAMTLSTTTLAFLGFLSPANRGDMLTAILVLYVLMGSFAGYWSATMYKFFNGKKWKRTTLATALLFPTLIFGIFWLIDLMVWSQGSSTAVSVSTFVLLLSLWLLVSMPLVFVGSYFGYRAESYSIPVRVNQIARHVPDQMWYTHPAFAIALGGILPFGAVCIELFFIMGSLWLEEINYAFSFVYVVFFILIATCAEITMVMCYFQLCNEDYRWWWRAFLSAGSSAGYLFVYSTWYFFSKLEITAFVSSVVYFGYMLVIALTFFLLTGSSGFFACFWFVRKIYSAIKVD